MLIVGLLEVCFPFTLNLLRTRFKVAEDTLSMRSREELSIFLRFSKASIHVGAWNEAFYRMADQILTRFP